MYTHLTNICAIPTVPSTALGKEGETTKKTQYLDFIHPLPFIFSPVQRYFGESTSQNNPKFPNLWCMGSRCFFHFHLLHEVSQAALTGDPTGTCRRGPVSTWVKGSCCFTEGLGELTCPNPRRQSESGSLSSSSEHSLGGRKVPSKRNMLKNPDVKIPHSISEGEKAEFLLWPNTKQGFEILGPCCLKPTQHRGAQTSRVGIHPRDILLIERLGPVVLKKLACPVPSGRGPKETVYGHRAWPSWPPSWPNCWPYLLIAQYVYSTCTAPGGAAGGGCVLLPSLQPLGLQLEKEKEEGEEAGSNLWKDKPHKTQEEKKGK